jgi:hypothetical protein
VTHTRSRGTASSSPLHSLDTPLRPIQIPRTIRWPGPDPHSPTHDDPRPRTRSDCPDWATIHPRAQCNPVRLKPRTHPSHTPAPSAAKKPATARDLAANTTVRHASVRALRTGLYAVCELDATTVDPYDILPRATNPFARPAVITSCSTRLGASGRQPSSTRSSRWRWKLICPA